MFELRNPGPVETLPRDDVVPFKTTFCPHDGKNPHPHITLDLDASEHYHPEPPVWKDIAHFWRQEPMCAHWRTSASVLNLHVLVCLPPGEYTVAQFFLWRTAHGDDKSRVEKDWTRWKQTGDASYATGALFDVKDGMTAGPWHWVEKVDP